MDAGNSIVFMGLGYRNQSITCVLALHSMFILYSQWDKDW